MKGFRSYESEWMVFCQRVDYGGECELISERFEKLPTS